MTQEKLSDLANNLIGFTETRGTAWWARFDADNLTDDQGRPNHFAGAIPLDEVLSRVFPWSPIGGKLFAAIPETITETGVSQAHTVEVEDRTAWFRSDTLALMGVHGSEYVPHDYRRWLIEHVAAITEKSQDRLGIGSAGTLKGGAVGWVQIEAPESMVTRSGIEYRPQILATTSLDGSIPTTYATCETVVVCDNTRNMALTEAEGTGAIYRVKHTRHSELRIPEAQEALGILATRGERFADTADRLVAVKVTPNRFSRFLDGWAPMPTDNMVTGKPADARAVTLAEKKRARVTELYKSDPRVAPWKGTGFGVLQAVNTYNQHETAIRDGSGGHGIGGKRFSRSILLLADGTLRKAETDAHRLLLDVVS